MYVPTVVRLFTVWIKKTGNAIARGENVPITDDVLTLIDDNFSQIKNCPYCGNEINSDFEYCPKCGKKL